MPRTICGTLVLLGCLTARAGAQTDEIQVYDGKLAPPGTFNLTWHNNFTLSGATAPAFPGAVVANHSWNGVPEWAYGVTPWLETGLYLPLYSIGQRNGQTSVMLDGTKLRLLFAVPHAQERGWFYGVNFELSYNARQWEARRVTSEIRPILGWRVRSLDLIVNPIVDISYDGWRNAEFAPATRLAYNVSHSSAVALEEYDTFGPLPKHQLYGVVDFASKAGNLEAGAGFGLTDPSDKLTLKLILSRDLN
jgi:hypothetical protein